MGKKDSIMTHYERCLCADILELAADAFQNHGCNDYPVDLCFDAQQLYGDVAEYAGRRHDPLRAYQDKIYFIDVELMIYFAHKLREENES